MVQVGLLYLGVHDGEHDEGEEVLDAEDDDGEGVLHVGVGPHLHTHGVLGPGQGHGLQGLQDARLTLDMHMMIGMIYLKCQDGRGKEE